ncbi:MAG: hypothetical protein ACODAD_15020 [Planctomycetota bacterium]
MRYKTGWRDGDILEAVGFVGMESCPAQAVLPLVGLAADTITRDRYSIGVSRRSSAAGGGALECEGQSGRVGSFPFEIARYIICCRGT